MTDALGTGPNSPLAGNVEGATTHEDGQGVSESAATLLAGGLALLGVVVGLFGDRYFRYRGDILCRSSEWSLTCTLRTPPNHLGHQNTRRVSFSRPMYENKRVIQRAEYGNYSCSVKLFNETEVDTGLRDIRVVFAKDSGDRSMLPGCTRRRSSCRRCALRGWRSWATTRRVRSRWLLPP